MVINVHAGHNPDGKTACGAVGFIRESTEARRVKDKVIVQLRLQGHTVYDTTCENGTSQANVLTKIVNSCNTHKVDLDVSIHFNSGANDAGGNGKTTGTEVYVYSTSSKSKSYAENVCNAIAGLGFKNRGVKTSTSLYFLKHTSSPAMLIECCFVDDKDDVELYDYKEMADAIVYGITGKRVQKVVNSVVDSDATKSDAETKSDTDKKLFRVQVGAYSVRDNAKKLKKELKAAGYDAVIVKA